MEGKETSFGSLKKVVTGKEKTPITTIDDLGEDLIQNVLNRLPALTFASASCVNHYWNRLCSRILFSGPKLSSAVSLGSSLQQAVKDVVDKVLSAPIRPHFALASIGPAFSLQEALYLIRRKIGFKTPLIINTSWGVIGTLVRLDQLVEVQWEVPDSGDLIPILSEADSGKGLILTVGFLPGLKAHIVPLLKQHWEPRMLLIDEFITDIRESTSSVSDSSSPAGIILYSDQDTDIKPVLQTLECAFPQDTFVVGDGGSLFLYRSGDANTSERRPNTNNAGVALVFARDRSKPSCIGETQFHVLLSPGLSPIGPTYQAVSVVVKDDTTWLTASNGMHHEDLDGDAILGEISDELGDRIQFPVYYIGVTKRRKCSLGLEKPQRMQFLEFHDVFPDVFGGDQDYLIVNSIGIKTGDPFRFYVADSEAALSYCNKVSEDLRDLKQSCGNNNRKVFGGMVFSCSGRGNAFLGPNFVDSSPFVENFPGIPFSGTYCAGEICRGRSSFYEEDNDESAPLRCSQHVYSAAYLVMSYSPPQPQQSTSGLIR